MALTVSELASRAGVPRDTIRYYERAGLLPSPPRTSAGYRQYEDESVERLRLIKGAQRAGLRLREVKELLEVLDRGSCPCGHTEALISKRLAEVDAEVARLADIRERLTQLQGRYSVEDCASDADMWPCRRDFIKMGGENHDAMR